MNHDRINFSFIIPTYNTPYVYFEKCISSIANQIDINDEIIVIDDGSKVEFTDKYQKMLSQISQAVFIQQNNAGVSVARNKGIINANGEYVIFVDSDDWLSDMSINKLRECCKQKMPDVLYFNSLIEFKNRTLLTTPDISEQLDSVELIKNIFSAKHPYSDIIGIDAPWGKAFNRDVILRNKILFPCGIKRCEDAIFCLNVLEVSDNITFLNETIYHYRMRNSSVCRKFDKDIISNEMQVIDYYSKYHSSKVDISRYLNLQIRKIVLGDFMTMYYMNQGNPDSIITRSIKAEKMFEEYPILKQAFFDNSIGVKKEKALAFFLKSGFIKLFYSMYYVAFTGNNLLKKIRSKQPVCFE